MKEVDLDGTTYRIGDLDPRTQFHITRRLGPVIGSLGASIATIVEGSNAADDVMARVMEPVMATVAKMPEEDVDYVINHCLAVVSRRDGEKWAAVMHHSGRLMYQDMRMPTMMRLVVETVKENMGDFFSLVPGGPA